MTKDTMTPIEKGAYVLATKWSDGDPGDPWGVGFYDGHRLDRHFIVDNDGKQIRHGGFLRVGRITPETGRWLMENAAVLEASPPGSVNLWGMITVITEAGGVGGRYEE